MAEGTIMKRKRFVFKLALLGPHFHARIIVLLLIIADNLNLTVLPGLEII